MSDQVILQLDLETFCETPIRSGTSRYAEDAEVLLSAFAIDDEPVEVVEGWAPALTSLANSADRIVIHNARFDRTVLKHQGVDLPVGKVHCTQAQARSVGLPGALASLCDILGVPVDKAKDKAGKSLIQLFCKPLPKNRKERRATKETHPVEWGRFMEYAGLDVEAMREVYKRLDKAVTVMKVAFKLVAKVLRKHGFDTSKAKEPVCNHTKGTMSHE